MVSAGPDRRLQPLRAGRDSGQTPTSSWRLRSLSRACRASGLPLGSCPRVASGTGVADVGSSACFSTRFAAPTFLGEAPVSFSASERASRGVVLTLSARVPEVFILDFGFPGAVPPCWRCRVLASRSSSGRNSNAMTARCPASRLPYRPRRRLASWPRSPPFSSILSPSRAARGQTSQTLGQARSQRRSRLRHEWSTTSGRSHSPRLPRSGVMRLIVSRRRLPRALRGSSARTVRRRCCERASTAVGRFPLTAGVGVCRRGSVRDRVPTCQRARGRRPESAPSVSVWPPSAF